MSTPARPAEVAFHTDPRAAAQQPHRTEPRPAPVAPVVFLAPERASADPEPPRPRTSRENADDLDTPFGG
ncbi:hypothetical protein ABZ805_22085 [Saccharopolyspora sp. NPDC047091]|uniref:hypothetical protein n=1 Tax=Saccharopolyspora sp. NPDC047091 TaxID=3155924 RepID=UPI003403EBD6